MMVASNENKRKERDEASGFSQPDKKQKVPSPPPSTVVHNNNVGATELASAFALASLASLNSPSSKDFSPPETRDVEHLDESSTASLEARSPKDEPVPITPEMRAPARPNHNKRVTFAPNIKDPTRLGPRRYSFPPRLNQRPLSRMPPGFARSGSFPRHPMMHPPSPQQHMPMWMHHGPSNHSGAFMPPSPPANQVHPSDQWVCDYCNVCVFPTYEEACAHEESCRARFAGVVDHRNQLQLTRGFPPSGLWSTRGGPMSRGPPFMPQPGMLPPSRMMGYHPKMHPMGPPIAPPRLEGPVRSFAGPVSLAIPESDPDWLSGLNCFIRKHCVEAFAASDEDVSKTSKRGRITLYQVGIRCCFCKHRGCEEKEIAAVSYPVSLAGLYESVKRWQRVHLEACKDVPEDVRNKLDKLNTDNSWIPTTRQYWTDSAKLLGMIDTQDGIRFSCEPSHSMARNRGTVVLGSGIRPIQEDASVKEEITTSIEQNGAAKSCVSVGDGEHVVFPQDTNMVPPYVYFLMRQVESCRFTEADRFVARSKGPVGYPGFQCRHCHGHAGLGKYFPVTSKSLATNSTSQNIHAHLLKCRKCPTHAKEQLVALKEEKSKAPRLEPGWRKVFFDKIWSRLHG